MSLGAAVALTVRHPEGRQTRPKSEACLVGWPAGCQVKSETEELRAMSFGEPERSPPDRQAKPRKCQPNFSPPAPSGSGGRSSRFSRSS